MHWQIVAELAAAWAAGGLIGAERTYHGRAAGFRTHALVSLAAASAVMISLAPVISPGVFPGDGMRADPTRLAQGVLTGIGFLGAGAIFKEGVSVQGLTTAASVWATAAIGLLMGLGEFFPGALATFAVLSTLVAMRWFEAILPANIYVWSVFRFRTGDAPDEPGLRALLNSMGITLRELSYARTHDGDMLEFSGNLMAKRDAAFESLAARLRVMPGLLEFELSRISK